MQYLRLNRVMLEQIVFLWMGKVFRSPFGICCLQTRPFTELCGKFSCLHNNQVAIIFFRNAQAFFNYNFYRERLKIVATSFFAAYFFFVWFSSSDRNIWALSEGNSIYPYLMYTFHNTLILKLDCFCFGVGAIFSANIQFGIYVQQRVVSARWDSKGPFES